MSQNVTLSSCTHPPCTMTSPHIFPSFPADDNPFVPAAGDLDTSDTGRRPQCIYGTRKASLALDVIVVGCGISGLSAAFCLMQAGHHVTIIEASPVIGEIGAGMQLSPNTTRLLLKWGLGKHLEEIAVRPEGVAYQRYTTGERIGFTKWGESLERDYGAPYYHIHRADLHKLLYDLVSPHATILLGSVVVGCDPDAASPSVILESGEIISADLIVGADGMKSHVRQVISGDQTPVELTGDAVYRTTIPTALMVQDPELREFVERPQMTAWIGPGRCVVAYPIRRKERYNIILLHPDDGLVESWKARGNLEKMRKAFDDFEPRVHKLLRLIQSAVRWRLTDLKTLDKWVHESGRVVLVGDACHPILPYRAQGAAMAIEDAAVLGNLLSRISRVSQLGPLLEAYQDLRHNRASVAQESSRLNRNTYNLPDGPEQRERDENMRRAMVMQLSGSLGVFQRDSVANLKSAEETKKSDDMFGYDADAEVENWWAANGMELEAFAGSKL